MAFAICFWRRRHYRKQGMEFSGSVFRWPPSTPALSYSDLRMPVPESPPPIGSFAVDLNRKPSVIWGPRPTSDEDAAMTEDAGMLERGQGPSPPQTAYTPQEPRGVGLANVESRSPAEHDPFGDLYAIQEVSTTGLAITTGHPLFRQSMQSYAVSTPSVYSEKTFEDDSSVYHETYSGTDHSLAHLNRNVNSASPPSTLSYSPQPPSPTPVSARHMMSEVTRIQGHQMVRSGPSQRL
ncbi:hypothetical protein FIBSPDRAFT_50177 [Athelia psychrophila]|uniref:Uncharacterized protein n=1 Tax=Athelia psychrophila TaxID=1759441 RepID=A0A166U7A1_9AGAM|nr:hypothetical protein FIBSPDRAFT_50177 [Fibularhizoctonia sp. CBS 109695]